jgi:hypothetical protein
MARLVISENGQPISEYQLKPGLNRIGRVEGNDCQIQDPSVSSSHCEVDFQDGILRVRDLNSTNGTFVNAVRIQETTLTSGQTMRLGNVNVVFNSDLPPVTTAIRLTHAGAVSPPPNQEVAARPAATTPPALPAVTPPPLPAMAPPVLPVVTCTECGRSFPPDEVINLSGALVCATCKPMAVQKLKEGGRINTAAEEIRKAHIKHEASVQSIGVLYILGACSVFFAGIIVLFAPGRSPSDVDAGLGLVVTIPLLGLGAFQLVVGFGVRQLKRWTRIAVGILSGIGLLAFPIGTLINGYILYLVLSEKGKTVFSEQYQEVIAATPHVKYKTSIVVWILLGLVIFLIGAAVMVTLIRK